MAALGQGARPLVLGGGHEIAWGSFQGLARWLESRGDDGAVLVLNLDAHFDLRTGRPGSSGTPFDQIASYCQERGRKLQYACLGVSRLANTPALFARADEVGAVWVEDRDMGERHLQARLEQLDDLLAAASHVPDHRPGRAARGGHARRVGARALRRADGGGRGNRVAREGQRGSGWPNGRVPRVSTWTATAPGARLAWQLLSA